MSKIYVIFVSIEVDACLEIPIWYVNTHTYSPEIREVPQGQTAEYCGLSYTIVNAEMWNSSDFYTQHTPVTSPAKASMR